MTISNTQLDLPLNSQKHLIYDLSVSVPHPIPYQGSKRKLAPLIAPFIVADRIETFFEPFAGSAAMTLFASSKQLAQSFHINDSLKPLVGILDEIIFHPNKIAERYEQIWKANEGNELLHYNKIRADFNIDGEPAKLLYLLARCVKNAVRFNSVGEFNQSADKRRLGTRPERMRREIFNASAVLSGRAVTSNKNFEEVLALAKKTDFVYMDPPWEGTSTEKDTRYHQLLNRNILLEQLELLVRKEIPFILSFDGRLGKKKYGSGMPPELGLTHLEINAGRSSQSTLSGGDESTFESLYLSPSLVDKLSNAGRSHLITLFAPVTDADTDEQ